MLLRTTVPYVPAGALLAAAFLLTAVPAEAQDRATYERLDRLERDLSMLQRQVYRGAPGPMVGGDPSAALNGEVRMDRLENQMRELTGRVEEAMNAVERLRQRVEQVNSDVDTRLSQGPAAGPLASAAPPPRAGVPGGRGTVRELGSGRELGPGPRDLPPRDLSEDDDMPPMPGRPGMPPPGFPVPPPRAGGTLTPPAAPPPGRGFDSAAAGPVPGALPSGSTTEQYNHAFGLLKQADYPAAETALRAFVEHHPNDAMAGNAQYWLGETYYARGKFVEAASAFAEGYKKYPKSAKAPDGLLKLGMALGRANQKQNACVALGQLDQSFPHAASTIKQRAADEKKRLGC